MTDTTLDGISSRAPRAGAAATGPALRLNGKAEGVEALKPVVAPVSVPAPGPGQCLVEVKASGVNMSDVKAALGHMPYAIWPRTPGRDYAGVVLEGPADLVGRQVWGSSGELGIRRDGTHCRYLVVSADEIHEKPSTITLDEAGAIGVPFITAYEGLQSAGGVKPTDVVLVLGGNGKVGQAVVQLATQAGARVFAVERTAEPYMGHASKAVEMIDASSQDIAAHVRERTEGHGADIVFNTVGSPYFEAACAAMAPAARQIFISTIDRAVPFDIFRFFRGRHHFIGIDSLALDGVACGRILEALRPGFESGKLKAFPVQAGATYSLDEAARAYAEVWNSSRDRIVLRP
jgi:NADPH:quinone reductase-like Zn-dependent oxidoreductase